MKLGLSGHLSGGIVVKSHFWPPSKEKRRRRLTERTERNPIKNHLQIMNIRRSANKKVECWKEKTSLRHNHNNLMETAGKRGEEGELRTQLIEDELDRQVNGRVTSLLMMNWFRVVIHSFSAVVRSKITTIRSIDGGQFGTQHQFEMSQFGQEMVTMRRLLNLICTKRTVTFGVSMRRKIGSKRSGCYLHIHHNDIRNSENISEISR